MFQIESNSWSPVVNTTNNIQKTNNLLETNIWNDTNTSLQNQTNEISYQNAQQWLDLCSEKTDSTSSNNKNEKIDDTKQGKLGDCWLLSGLNALSYCEEGKKIISNALVYDKNGTSVFFNGFNIKVSNNELNSAMKSGNYASGDKDMVIFELAIEKALKNIASGKLKIDISKMSQEMKTAFEATISSTSFMGCEADENPLNGGRSSVIMYLLTGKEAECAGLNTHQQDKDSILNLLDKFENNPNGAMSISLMGTQLKTLDGKTIGPLFGGHAFAVKEIKDGIVTLIDPEDSSKVYKVKEADLLPKTISFNNKSPKIINNNITFEYLNLSQT